MNTKSLVLLLVLLLMAIFASPHITGETLDLILEKHSATIGNVEAWHQLKSLTFKLAIKEPGFEVDGVYRISRSGKMRIDIFADGKQIFTEAFNGVEGWQWQPGQAQAKIIDGKKAAALRHGIELPGHLFTLLDMQQQGNRLEYVGDEDREGCEAHILLLTLKDGHEKYYIIDAKTGLMLANRDQRAFHPDIDDTEVLVESRPSDYRNIEGAIRSFRGDNYDLTNDKWLGTTRIIDIKVNAPVDDSYFESANTKARPFTNL